MLPDLLSHNPITGIGVGGADVYLETDIIPLYERYGAHVYLFYDEQRLEQIFQGVIPKFFSSHGLLSILILIRFQRFIRLNTKHYWIVWYNIIVASMSLGAMVDLRFWLFSLLCILAVSNLENHSNAKRTYEGFGP